MDALEKGKCLILEDALLLSELRVDVIVESTGVAEAGPRSTLEAIHQGKHVAMVNNEADCVVGPVLENLADRAGVVCTAADASPPPPCQAGYGWRRPALLHARG